MGMIRLIRRLKVIKSQIWYKIVMKRLMCENMFNVKETTQVLGTEKSNN